MNWLRKWFYSGLSTGGFWIAKKLGYQFVLFGVFAGLFIEGVYRKQYATGIEIDVLLIAISYIGFQAFFIRLSKLLLTDYGYLGALRRYAGLVIGFIASLLIQYSLEIPYDYLNRGLKIINLAIVFPLINGFKIILEVQSAQLFSVTKKAGFADVPDFNRININRSVFSLALIGTLIFSESLLSDWLMPQDFLWVAVWGVIALFSFNLSENIKSGNHGLGIQEVKPPENLKKSSPFLRSSYFRLVYLSTLILLIFTALTFSMELEKLTLNHENNFERFLTLIVWYHIFIVAYQEFGKGQIRKIKTSLSLLIIPAMALICAGILVLNHWFGEYQSPFYQFAISLLFIIIWVGGGNVAESLLDVALNHCSAAEKFATRRILSGYKIRFWAVVIIGFPVVLRYNSFFSIAIPINEYLIYTSLLVGITWFNISRGLAKLYGNRFVQLKENLQLAAVGLSYNNFEEQPTSIISNQIIPSINNVHKEETEIETEEKQSNPVNEIFQESLNSVEVDSAETELIAAPTDDLRILPADLYFDKYASRTIEHNEPTKRNISPYRNLLQILSESDAFSKFRQDLSAEVSVKDLELDHIPAGNVEDEAEDTISLSEAEMVSSEELSQESPTNDLNFDKSLPENTITEEETVDSVSGSRIIDLGRLLNSNELSSQFQAIDIIKSTKYDIKDILALISYAPVVLRNQIIKQWDENTVIHAEHELYPKFVGLLKDTSELLVWLQVNINEIHSQSVENLFLLSNMYYLSKQVQSQIIQILSFNLGVDGAKKVEEYLNNIETDTDVVFNIELLDQILPPAVKPYLIPIYEPTTFGQKQEQWKQLIPLFSGDINERYLDIALKDFSLIPISIKFWALRILYKKHFDVQKLNAFQKSNITSLKAAVATASSKYGTTIERFIAKSELKSIEDVFVGSEIFIDWLNGFENEKKLRDAKINPEVIYHQRKNLVYSYLV